MSNDKQNTENELAMAILNGMSGPNACKAADEQRRMIPLHVADQAVAACENEIAQLKARAVLLEGQITGLRHRAEALREAGDELWFCLRHAKRLTHAEIQEAVEDWQAARDGR
jgi:hypothetical protein